ncbi:MAG: hypothetical protein EAZ57_02705 [Cytophagales bacterium]|nr:MAG: hypothetical protein EAZ67_03170 [Cytophagales bacterium]TAF61673.1 MAG: hypothetical protein EAZ57_02705 [Cytophagales bacterium]
MIKSVKPILMSLFAAIALMACEKTMYEESVIDGNTAPPDKTISNALKETYINKLYISLLGRKPEKIEFDIAFAELSKDNASVKRRENVIEGVMGEDEYNERIFEIARQELLNSVDMRGITEQRDLYIFFRDFEVDPLNKKAMQREVDKLNRLLEVPNDLNKGTLTIQGLHRRCVDNTIYDEINMGTENFVVSMFQNFLLRYPTTDTSGVYNELEMASNMVNGNSSVLFLEEGSSKSDFIDLVLNSTDYFEGQIRLLYRANLYRDPRSEEIARLVRLYKTNKDFKALQKAVFSSDEYFGLK